MRRLALAIGLSQLAGAQTAQQLDEVARIAAQRSMIEVFAADAWRGER